ncbi:hypothetical protein J132_01577 [Termitomyces sp. J132]|nr:hypothetical protein J132_01577 [Termitomyces sp. J132]
MVDNIQSQLQISFSPIQPPSSTSSFPPALAPTLAPIAEAEEHNNDEAAQPKEDESKMDCATTVATTVDQSAIADNSALISNPIATVTNSGIPSRSGTNSVTPTRPAASITNSAIATRLAASDESTVTTGVESILASPIAATGQLMNVDMTGPAPPHAPDEIVLQCGCSASCATQPPTEHTHSFSCLVGKRKANEHAEEAVAKKIKKP